jgi:hypothetical protein
MENEIKLVVKEDKSIEIQFNSSPFCVIESTDKKISADELYKLFDFSLGDSYFITSDNPQNLEIPVLNQFMELLEDIRKRLEELNVIEDENPSTTG